MKPVKLIIEGINSFIERQELDFSVVGRSNLFCICGKTGAGKSTVFDSLMLALYGRSSKGNLAEAVNLSLTTAFVSLEFVEGDDTYLVERTIKCRKEKAKEGSVEKRQLSGTECMLYKNGEPFAKGSDETTARITEIIGLDVSEFKNVYLLEQGEYADFLKKQPAKQTEAVGKIFSLMRFGDVYKRAAEKQKEEAAAVAAVDDRINDIGDDAPETLKTAKTLLSSMRAKNTALLKELEAAREGMAAFDEARLKYASFAEKQKAIKANAERLDEEKRKCEKAAAQLDEFEKNSMDGERNELELLHNRITELTELNVLDKQCGAAESELKAKTEARNKKADMLRALTQAGDGLTARVEESYAGFRSAADEFIGAASGAAERSDALNRAIELLKTQDRAAATSSVPEIVSGMRDDKRKFDELNEQLDKQKTTLDGVAKKKDELVKKIALYGDELERLTAEQGEKRQASEHAADEYAAAVMKSRAEAVRGELKIGDICPVCGGVYNGAECVAAANVESKKKAADDAAAAVKAVEENIANTQRLCDNSKYDLDHTDGELKAAESIIAELTEKIKATCVDGELYKNLSVITKKLIEFADGFNAATAQKNAQSGNLAAAQAEQAAAAAALEEAAKAVTSLREKLGDSYGKTDEMLAAAKSRAGELEQAIKAHDSRRAELAAEAEAAKAATAAVQKMLDEAMADYAVDVPEFDEEKYDEARGKLDEMNKQYAERERDIAVKSAEADALTERCEKLKILRAERTQKQKAADNYAKIAELTKSKAMLNYVVTEYIEQFTAAASEILSELSGGKYQMGYDGDNGFTVSDFLNGGKSRKTDTLSGGEMFLASLSVAIAIARSVGGGNNAFFFLDEGFGTLDEELIDTVYAALEMLSNDCLVGVISHAGALIERMPSCVEVVEATDVSGSKIRY